MTITVNNGRMARIAIEGLGELDAGVVDIVDETRAAFRGEISQVRRVKSVTLDGTPYRVVSAEKGDVKGTVRLVLAAADGEA